MNRVPAIESNSLPFVIEEDNGFKLNLFVYGVNCASCIRSIEGALKKIPNVTYARVNMSTKRLVVKWQDNKALCDSLINAVEKAGYKTKVFDPSLIKNTEREEEKTLLKYIAVAGFAAGNIMLLSFALWTSSAEEMGVETRSLLHWFSALIAMPAIIYSGRAFFKPAFNAIKNRSSNMDIPISVALIITMSVSFYGTIIQQEDVYFDSAIMLLFFLLIGRYLDKKARSKSLEAAGEITSLLIPTANIIKDGKAKTIKSSDIKPNMILIVAKGEHIASDGVIIDGESEIDNSLISGESIPQKLVIGDKVFAGTLNLGNPIKIKTSKTQDNALLSDIIKLMEKAEQRQSKYINFSEKVTKLYTPIVHLMALATFIFYLFYGSDWQMALLTATTVLIITCPCAIALAVPVVQVIASGNLFKNGVFIKSGNALEKLSDIDILVIDKTGTLTLGKPELKNIDIIPQEELKIITSMASKSLHPLSQALMVKDISLLNLDVKEVSGSGLETKYKGKTARLGNKEWCGINDNKKITPPHITELWFKYGDKEPLCLLLEDKIRPDAKETIEKLKENNIKTILLSGDRAEIVQHVALKLGIEDFHSEQNPADKINYLKELKDKGLKPLMIGDGLNDAPALAEAHASISPGSAIDITKNTADIIFQGQSLMPVFTTWQIAKQSQKLVKQNIFLSLIYNSLAIPLAISGNVTPLIAAVAMSASSLIVTVNSFRAKNP